MDTYFKYDNTFDKLEKKATVGYSYQKFEGSGSFTGNLRDPNSIPGVNINDDVINLGYFSRLELAYNEKYRLTANYRRDGTSRFGPDNRFGNFFGAAAAWQISEEDFLKDSETISSLTLRASYGENGQQEINQGTIYLDRFRLGDASSQLILGGVVITPAVAQAINRDLKWEETSTIEIGIDYGLFDDKITGSINAYRKESKDLLFPTQIAEGANFTNRIIRNIGDSRIDGLEFSINADIIDKEDMNWSINFNGSFFDREISNLPLGLDITTGGIAGGTGNFIQLLREGIAPNSFYVFKQLYDTAGSPIEGAYADLDGNGIINNDDRYIKNNPDPDATFGFQSTFNYKGFDFAFNLRASIGNYVYNNVNSSTAQTSLLQDQAVLGNIPTSVLNTNFVNTSDVILSDIYIENGSFLRMDNITLGYTFNNKIKGFKSIRLWTGVQNVFIISEYSGLDPEVFGGIDNTIYPRARTFLFGANIKF
jgi:iron complex outermembrane receptor protein